MTHHTNSGSYAIAISNLPYGALKTAYLSVTGNTEYDLYAMVRGEMDADDTHGNWYLWAKFYNNGNFISTWEVAAGTEGSLTTSWMQQGGRITTPANANQVEVVLYLILGAGWAAWDDVSLTRVSDDLVYNLTYDYENRLTGVSGAATATFIYDGDGNRVKGTVNGTNVTYIGSHFEWKNDTTDMVKYYYAGGARVAMRVGSSTRYYLLSDHLGSTTITANSSGVLSSEKRYMPWGEQRWANGTLPTTFHYTGQREQAELGLYFYQSRWYDAALSRFIQADSIIPDPYNSQSWDRYHYAGNNPLRYVDPTGHWYYDPGCDCLVYTGYPGNEYPDSLYYNENTSTNFFFPDVPEEMIGEFDPVAQTIISWFLEPLDWAMTYGYCKDEGCGLLEIGLTLLPLLPNGLSRTISKVLPQGQWHHILSTKIMRALDEHPTLRGVFDRGEALIQALDSESHRGYQTWHRIYDDEVVEWINNAGNAAATPEDFINFLISIYQNTDLQHRFPEAVEVLESLLESFR